jgi:hypothetical protein
MKKGTFKFLLSSGAWIRTKDLRVMSDNLISPTFNLQAALLAWPAMDDVIRPGDAWFRTSELVLSQFQDF